MPLGDILIELAGGLARFVGHVLIDLLFEGAIKIPGLLICRHFKADIDPDCMTVVVVGLLFWLVLGGMLFGLYHFLAQQLVIDRCLDAGGAFDEGAQACEF